MLAKAMGYASKGRVLEQRCSNCKSACNVLQLRREQGRFTMRQRTRPLGKVSYGTYTW